jgi:hypothetical protein
LISLSFLEKNKDVKKKFAITKPSVCFFTLVRARARVRARVLRIPACAQRGSGHKEDVDGM